MDGMSLREGEDTPYWEGLEAGRLMLPRCAGCQAWRWPAGHRCGQCGHSGMAWVEQAMAATVFSWTRTWHRFGLTEGLELPYTNVVAQLTGSGIRLMGLLDDPAAVNPAIGEALTGRIGSTRVGSRHLPVIIWSRSA